MKYIYSGRTDIGLKRKVNQDSFGTARLPWGSIFVLSDGFGHKEGGKFASQSAVDIFVNNYSKEDPNNIEEFFKNSFDEINKYIYYKKVSEYDKAMLGCTAVVMVVEGETVHIAHIGDSRAYIIRDNGIEQLTTDHSYVQTLIEEGKLLPENAMFHSKRHVLIRALGSHRKAKIDYSFRSLGSDDKLIICCDGVWGFVSQSTIQEILNSYDPSQATSKLIEIVKKNSGSDNITLQVISLV